MSALLNGQQTLWRFVLQEKQLSVFFGYDNSTAFIATLWQNGPTCLDKPCPDLSIYPPDTFTDAKTMKGSTQLYPGTITDYPWVKEVHFSILKKST